MDHAAVFPHLYGGFRHLRIAAAFGERFGAERTVELFSAPGRSEIGGNHTDHQQGRVLAAAVTLDAVAVAAKNDQNVICIYSEGHGEERISLEKLGGAFFLSIVIPFFLSSFLRIRQMEHWQYLILLPLEAAFLSDAFALFAGMAFGKHKLAPELSPKKTVEGAVGGLLGSILCCLIYGAVMQFGFGLGVSYLRFALYGALGSLVSQLGDLSFSYIKRQYGLKDFGNIFPGHGGVLDRFDSVIFCAPLIEILIHWLPAIWEV